MLELSVGKDYVWILLNSDYDAGWHVFQKAFSFLNQVCIVVLKQEEAFGVGHVCSHPHHEGNNDGDMNGQVDIKRDKDAIQWFKRANIKHTIKDVNDESLLQAHSTNHYGHKGSRDLMAHIEGKLAVVANSSFVVCSIFFKSVVKEVLTLTLFIFAFY